MITKPKTVIQYHILYHAYRNTLHDATWEKFLKNFCDLVGEYVFSTEYVVR